MPKMVMLAANPAFKPENEAEKAAFAAAKAKGPIQVDYVTAIENVGNSRSMYLIAPSEEQAKAAAVAPRSLDDMSLDELKIMMLSLGIRTEKQMKRADVQRLIRAKMDQIDVSEDAE